MEKQTIDKKTGFYDMNFEIYQEELRLFAVKRWFLLWR